MRIIYFKRAGAHGSLHPQYITEHIDSEFLTAEQKAAWSGESLIEEHFLLELAKNAERHEAHLKYLKEQEDLALKAREDSILVDQKNQRELEREFETFKRWKLKNQQGAK